ncbi:MAG: hypothetical protein JXA92_04945 [candidate division Zixibacteria bacterium]|nr:hypothetical protein [candidate division Zixibacteria bacterium]
MSFCPRCRYEYEAGITVCPDCNEMLVDILPEEEEAAEIKEYINWVQLARLTSLQSVEMLQEVFGSKSIPVVVQSGTGHFGITGQMGPSSFRPVGGQYSIFVPEEFVADADQEAGLILGDEWEESKLFDIEEE